ncbi:alkanesulfonate monooxygenase SsuD/methylene tetrahydromethanopterin reductase-like flavin-dependent oxidoreductase (luciferase family) [Microbacteriaceae bacterium SG_E_30_P1]|uniref:Alkanesulfonate monooxygenase SsuD/methylene tetrahydromethanopterin reductase-like flavin-dependent oxidoreductase (Luciferase family) n=1 Tax=Antiquaquibacter oligotrophicus TaxID=2880260 RepID=A0ABT6KQ92_9MICO|nr:LLM class flavin-dependent oxidoreductase [Antiquaquibacter oligotrophicus]MDH6182029.1 alkanesulfonate monooxygenase SsuD/methylene tetrahydromethanopterin reductase-like flavin-dependent oxidoreductase (luciferase family) [Antiquaquibacter oligotrophicus]UDF12303.1 LLM class flavin-dependent oxidoreductase [Antiquaquibacter oligotrophicus]
MPDYGHSLEFGVFITPTAAAPQQPVALAQLAEQLGYDVATFQDHPYQPSFLDTWTLMSWVGASTESITISANVHSLPLRPPAVLARSAASLDLLSGGRVALGLGAGAFWDAIEAMGVPRLTAGQAVTALDEGIDIIRGIWDAANRTPLRVSGEFHSVDGAKRGPAPAHDIPIWIGAYKPRMLKLTGAKGDGWSVSLPYLQPGDLEAGNATIDEAATAAGRDPREIRRLLNVSGELSVSQLVDFALDKGIGTFILAADDPRVMQSFSELIPEVREQVAAERATRGTEQGRVRNAVALSKRREGVDYDGVPASLAADAVEPGDARYERIRNGYMRGGSPGIILRPGTTEEVTDALAYAARHRDLPLGIRSGGHGISGRSTNDGGVVIDLRKFDRIEVLDESKRLVRIGAGARWGDVAARLSQHGWALSSGDYGGVGVGGLATAGGVGYLGREHGLTIDHVRAADVVLADGTAVRASATENPDLFWALRGAGANFGVVTSFDFEVDEVGEVGWVQLAYDASDLEGFLERWGAAQEAAPRDVTTFLLVGRSTGSQIVAQLMGVVDSDDPDTIIERLQPFANLGPLLQQEVQLKPYAAVMGNTVPGDQQGQGEPKARSGLVRHLTPEVSAALARFIRSGVPYFFQIRSVGGAVADVAPDATAYAHRDANFAITALGTGRERLDEAWDTEVYPHLEGLYLSFETDQRPERIADAFPPATLTRLRELKKRYDPTGLFRDNFPLAG